MTCEDDACDCADEEELEEDVSSTDEDEGTERPISLELSRAEAITLMHIAWEKEIEFSATTNTLGLSHLISGIGRRVGKEMYNDEMTTWLEEREKQVEESRSSTSKDLSEAIGNHDAFDKRGFQ